MLVCRIGGAINASTINSHSISTEKYNAYYTSTEGHSSVVGSANVRAQYYYTPSGISTISGYVIEAYGQLAVVGGNSTVTPFTLPCARGFLWTPSGVSQTIGAADYRSLFAVQPTQNKRTLYIKHDTERTCAVLPYEALCTVLPTVLTEVCVPKLNTYY